MATNGNQMKLGLAFGVHHAPVAAPAKVVRQVETAAQALAISIAAAGCKLDYIGACVGKSRAYVSRLQNGKRPIPARLVIPLCAATGSLLLRQFLELESALETVNDIERLARMLREAA